MTETQNISIMAELISTSIFSVFKWKTSGPTNEAWQCVNSELHNRQQHPSDVVFYYDEPYSQLRTYVNIDLKSYARGTIKKGNIENSLTSLKESVSCANSSSDWQKIYTHDGRNFQVHGVLFIYNHDGEYDKDFTDILHKTKFDSANQPLNSKLFVFSPQFICYLNSVAVDFNLIRLTKNIRNEDYECFYPDLQGNAKLISDWNAAASIEALTSPLTFFKYKTKDGVGELFSIVAYSSRIGETRDEFMYLIDLLFSYQIFQNAADIEIRLINYSNYAAANFQKAKEQYVDEFGGESVDLTKRLDKLKLGLAQNITTKFSTIEIGMRNE